MVDTELRSATQLLLDGPSGKLEAHWAPAIDRDTLHFGCVAVVCHPHPLHGGNMTNKVVTTVERALRSQGVGVLRFNFRGVGISEGEFDQGRGELDDLLAIVDWLREQGLANRLMLAGFSFGSAIAAQAVHRLEGVERLLLLAPPIERYRFDEGGKFPCPVTVVQGGSDERVNCLGVYDWVGRLASPATLIRLPEACHFFHGLLSPLKSRLVEDLRSGL